MDSEEELMVKAEGLCRVKGRLVSLSQLVYQSVKAPQIERQDKERRRPFDDYELVIDKPAGVIVKIRKKRRIIREGLRSLWLDFDADEIIEKFDFYLSLKIEGQPYDETLCSESLRKEDVEFKQDLLKDYPRETSFITEKSYCSFSWSDIEDEYIYKFISLPTGLREPLGQELGPVEVEILSQLKPKNSLNNEFVELCESSKTFTVNRLEPRSFKVLFTGMAPPPISKCKVKDKHGKIKQIFTATKEQDIEICFDVNLKHAMKGGWNKTALFYVRSLEMAELLVSQGADVTIKGDRDYTPLHFAHNPETAKFFLDQGLDLEAQDNNGDTPLYEAVLDGRIATARFLFEQGANPYAAAEDDITYSGETALRFFHLFVK